MSPTRRIALLSTLTSAPVIAAPFLAIGDNAEVYLTASTQARYEDNISLTPGTALLPTQDDMVYEFTPGFELVYGKKGNFKSSLAVYEQFVRYSDLTNLDSDLFNAVWNASYQAAKLSVDADASYREVNQNDRGTAGAINSRRDIITGGAHAEYEFSAKTKGGVGIQYSETSFASGALTDFKSYTIPVNYYYGISPKVDLSAGFRYSETSVDAVNSDSEDYNFNVGARGEFTAKLNGSFDVGYTVRNQDAGGDDGVVALNAGLAYDYSPKTQFSLNARTGFDTSASGNTQKTYGLTLGASTQFTDAFGANASIGYQRIEIDDVFGREDDYLTAALGLSYTVTRNFSLGANYSHSNNASNNAVSEFVANTVSVSANFRY
jgi:polysaccharide biosynthesis protein VpsM